MQELGIKYMKRNNEMKQLYVVALAMFFSVSYGNAAEQEKHLFILSGQSNMAGLDPSLSFTPAVEAKYGKE